MAATNFRTEKLLKELTALFQKRVHNFEDLQFFLIDGDRADTRYCYGKGNAYRRCINDMLVAFDLTSTELYRKNDDRFELAYLTEREKELDELYEQPASPILQPNAGEQDGSGIPE